jgi:hypothetical protein
MADLGYYDDKLLKEDPNNPGASSGGSGQISSGGSGGTISGGGPQGGGAVSTAGVGAGGQGAWTNIQAYLNANKKDTGSAQALQSKVGGVLGQEKQNLETQAGNTLNQANDQAKTYDDAKANTGEWINKAANAYSWDGQHGDEYRNTVNKVQGLRNQAYQGPQEFTYGNSQDLSRAGEAVNNDDSFKSYLGDLYKQRTGGQLNSGQASLQNQFDVNNENLANTRNQLKTQLADFDTAKNDTIQKTDAGIHDAQGKYLNQQAGYNDYLSNLQNQYDSSINQQEIDARKAYQNEFSTNKSGLNNAKNDSDYQNWVNAVSGGGTAGADAIKGNQYGYWGNDLTYDQLQKEKNNEYYGTLARDYSPQRAAMMDRRDRNESALNKFYQDEDQKYGMTADQDERKYNTLADILGSLNKKQKGFAVRG